MEKPVIFYNKIWFVILVSFSLFFFLLCAFDYANLTGSKTSRFVFLLNSFTSSINPLKPNCQKPNVTAYSSLAEAENPASKAKRNFSESFDLAPNNFTVVELTNVGKRENQKTNVEDSCLGHYIYVHDLPSQFNDDVLKNCTSLIKWFDMCPYVTNFGLGHQIKNNQGVLSKKSWFATNQFILEVIFRNRMKNYKCLTNDSSMASAIYVPFYAGFDIGRYLWGYNTSVRDSLALGLTKWLAQKPEWKRMWGRDHFFVSGRIAWDFRRLSDNESDWGSKLMSLPESMNMTMLSIESTSWSNEFAIPYPTYFHPSSDAEVFQWQNRMRRHRRRHLFSFAGAPRPNMNDSIRNEIINQCLASRKECYFLDCNSLENRCDKPVEVMKVFRDSVFCLQPPGDSYTRRSTFDSILAGCIPVFFHPGSAYAQYIWHLPKNYTKYSVFIPMDLVKDGNVSIKEALLQVPQANVLSMREEVVKLIPKLIYADPRSKLESLEDAFDIAVEGVLERVEKVRRDFEEGRDPSIGFAKENSWKLKLSGTGKEIEWDKLF